MSSDLLKHAKDLSTIRTFLDRHSIPDKDCLKGFSRQLLKIDRSIGMSISHSPDLKESLTKQREIVQRLSGRCHQLEVRRDVIDLAESAEELANSSPSRDHNEIALEADELRNRIQIFLDQYRPSRNNAKFLRFANACIDKAENHEGVISGKKNNKKILSIDLFEEREASIDSFDLAELLYALGGFLYRENLDGFKQALERDFSEVSRMEIRFHVSECGGDLKCLETNEDRMRTIQGILGYAHKVTDYYTDSTPYPSIIQIHHTFEDLDLVTYIEDEVPTLK